MKVIVATMFYDDGDRDVRVFANEAGLQKWKESIAARRWEHNCDGVEMPSDPAIAAEWFFDSAYENMDAAEHEVE
jgi:hypothetical protein